MAGRCHSTYAMENIAAYCARDALDTYRLSRVHIALQPAVRMVIAREIFVDINWRLMAIFGAEYPDFLEALERSRAVIGGSFILQCILHEKWPDSDIDIFAPVTLAKDRNQTPAICTFLSKSACRNCFYSGERTLKYWRICTPTARIMRVNNFIITGCCSGPPVQLVTISVTDKSVPVTSFINAFTDFTICKNAFLIENGKQVIRCKSFQNVCTRFERQFALAKDPRDIANVEEQRKQILRYCKYRQRDFQFKHSIMRTLAIMNVLLD